MRALFSLAIWRSLASGSIHCTLGVYLRWLIFWPVRRAHVAPRLGRVRISPHVYNDEADVDRFLEIWGKVTR
jgi:selenocysteine lyase/cysteine desulfurase